MKSLKWLLPLALPVVSLSQAQPKQTLLVTDINNITTGYNFECGGVVDCIDNRSTFLRNNIYHSISATGTGTWQVQIQVANGSPSGFTMCGSGATVNQSSSPNIAVCFGYYDYLSIAITGANASTVAVKYSGQNQLVPMGGGGSGGGGLTSVGIAMPNWFSVIGSPLLANGTITVTAASGQTSHQVIGTCGSMTSFSPCVLTASDIPSLPYLTANQTIAWTASGDASGSASGATSISPSLTIIGILNKTLPSLSTGNLRYNGSAWIFDATAYLTANQTITFTPSGDVSGSASGATSLTPVETVVGLQGKILPSLATGNLRYNGSAFVYDATAYAPLASPTFTGTVTMPAPTFNTITGSVQCLQISSGGVVSGTGSACGAGGGGANAAGYYWVSQSTNAPANAINIGSLSTGLLKISVSGSVATPSTATYTDVVATFSGGAGCTGTNLLAANGTCQSSGSGNVSTSGSPAQYEVAVWASGTTILGVGPGAANMPLLGGGASANPAFSTISYPTSVTSGGVLFASSTTALTNSADFTISSHTMTAGNLAILDLSSASTANGFKIPISGSATPVQDGVIAINSSTGNHTLVWGYTPGTSTMVAAVAATGTGTATTCSSQVVTAISGIAIPTCTALTSSYLPLSAMGTITGGTWNGSTITVAYGGTGSTTFTAGIIRGNGTVALTGSELSGDATTSGSNAVTVVHVNGVSYPTTGSSFDALPILTASNTVGYYQINGGSNCGDSTHALSYSQSTHLIGCQSITATASAGGSNGQIQYNNSSAIGGFTAGGDVTFSVPNFTVVGVNGTTVPTTASADQVLLTTASAVAAWKSIGNCLDTGGQHLNYATSTHSFSCGTSGGGASVAWSAILNPAGNLALTMGANTTTFTYNNSTGSSDLFKLTDGASNTGTGLMFHITTATGSMEAPFQADSNGVGYKIDSNGHLLALGSTTAFFNSTGTWTTDDFGVQTIYGTPASWYSTYGNAFHGMFGTTSSADPQSDGLQALCVVPSSAPVPPGGSGLGYPCVGIVGISLSSSNTVTGVQSFMSMGVNGSSAWGIVTGAFNGQSTSQTKGVSQAASSSSLTLASYDSPTSGTYNGMTILATWLFNGNLISATATISTYVGSSRIANISGSWVLCSGCGGMTPPTQPANTSDYVIYNGTSNTYTGGGGFGIESDISNAYDANHTNSFGGFIAFGGVQSYMNNTIAFQSSWADGGTHPANPSGWLTMPWTWAFYSKEGSANVGLELDPEGPCVLDSSSHCTGGTNSQPIWLVARDSGGAAHYSVFYGDTSGSLVFYPSFANPITFSGVNGSVTISELSGSSTRCVQVFPTGLLGAATGGCNTYGGITNQNPYFTPTRQLGTAYANATGVPMFVQVTVLVAANSIAQAYSNGNSSPTTGQEVGIVGNLSTTASNSQVLSFWVLPGSYYEVTAVGGSMIYWIEWQ